MIEYQGGMRSVRYERCSEAYEGTRTLQGVCADVRAKLRASRKGIAYNMLEGNMLCREGPGGITDDNISKHRKMRHVEGQGTRGK